MSFALCHIEHIMPGWHIYIYTYMYMCVYHSWEGGSHERCFVSCFLESHSLAYWTSDWSSLFVCLMQFPNPPVLLQIVHSHRIYATGIFTYIPHMDPMGSKTHHLRNDLSILEVLEPCSYLVAFSGAPWRHVLMKRWWELGKRRSDRR